jgi:hypothetical protein
VFESGNRWTRLTVEAQSQPLALVVENTAGRADDDLELVITDGARRIERPVPESSLSVPADTAAAVSAGAYVRNQGMAQYSSRGPTDDGRRGVDLTGYTNIEVDNRFYTVFPGTSAAAPYIGGVAALIEQQHQGDASPAELETALLSTSDDIREQGADTVSGAGVVNAGDAIESVAIPTPTPTPTPPADAPDLSATVQESGTPGEAARVEYTLSNTSGQSSVALEITELPQQVSVNQTASTTSGVFGSDGREVLFPQPSSTVTATIAYDIAASAEPTTRFNITAVGISQDGATSETVTIEVGNVETGPIDRFDDDGDGEISLQEVQTAIRAFSDGDISLQDVQKVIVAFSG